MNASPESESGFAVDQLRPTDRAAAEWSLRMRRGLTAAEESEFEQWLAQHPGHATCFAEFDATSRLLDQLREAAPAAASPDPGPKVAWVVRSVFSRRSALAVTLAAAAAIALVWLGQGSVSRSRATDNAFARSIAFAETPRGQVALPDGSTIQLAAASAVDVKFTATERHVRVTAGEAYFTVAKNPRRPFFAEAGAVSVRAVGTAFNVRYQREAVEVIVTEGRVQVAKAGQSILPTPQTDAATSVPPTLAAGEKATVPTVEASLADTAVPAPTAAPTVEKWQSRRFEFVDTPLPEVVAQFNRYNAHKLVIGDPALESRTFGGVFAPTGQESFVEMLEQSFGIIAQRTAGETTLRRAR